MKDVNECALKKELNDLIKNNSNVLDFVESNALDGWWYWDFNTPDNKCISEHFLSSLGYDMTEVTQKKLKWTDFILPEDYKKALKKIKEYIKHPATPYDQVLRYKHANNSIVWIRSRAILIRDDNKEASKILGVYYNITTEKEKEIALERSNKQLNEIVAGTGDLVFILDNTLKIKESFSKNAEVDPVTKNFLKGKNLIETGISEKGIKQIVESVEKVLASGKRKRLVFDIKQGDNVQWYEMNVSKMAMQNGSTNEIFCVAHNFTKRKGAEDQLLEKTEELDSFFSMAIDLLAIANQEGKFLKLNKSWEDTLGFTIEELKSVTFLDLIHPDDIQATISAMENLGNGNIIPSFINRYRCKDGTYRFIEWRSRPKGDLIYAAARDITQSKNAADEIKKIKELLEQTNSLARVGGWEVDTEKNEIIWSDMAKNIHEVALDFKPEIDSGFKFCKYPEAREILKKLMENSLKTGESWEYEFVSTTAKGNDIWIRLLGQVEIKNGIPIRMYGTIQDIDAIKKASQSLEKALTEAKQAAEAKSAFLSNMSHEIRTPLNAVLGMTHLLLEGSPREDQINKLKTLKFSGDNLLALVNDILDYNKIESGMITFEKIPFNLYEITHTLKQGFQFKAEEKGIRLKVQMDSDVPKVIIGDPTRLTQILNNLISNALKFTEEGKVTLGVEVLEEEEKDIVLLFEIIDTGIGISQSQIDKIFERFTQANDSTTRKFGGTGLGLSIVKRLIELQGSQIKIESEEGNGSSFSFRLRFGLAKEEENSNGVVKNQVLETNYYDLQGLRVLLVEDNMVNQLIATEFLNSWNVSLELAENGLVAVEKVTDNNYDVILMDIQMPEMDGYQATMRIKAMGREKANIPILAMTASAMLDVRDKLHSIGLEDHILKPFNPQKLNSKLYAYMPKQVSKN
ncbi:PAS domain-containing hybrid sensor histidine kinase/response regulator [Chondrinema litorale]|uniref:PAS domain-containing hybrid sensor histidine kinase/response regulator n=1 Tax=Chondrinema litorale TaxID=2994555 RepID=UPI002543907E|nr:PAS domain-containing protein [Chondrinema litorale]UZR99297.1 PAS domain-containing protein [Chondrinema litorale]